MGLRRALGISLCGVLAAPALWGGSEPVTVSPGSATGEVIEDRCPTFSWGGVAGARSYELVVYRVGEEGEEARPVLRQRLVGSASGWTPSLDRCLERGERYAWSVRALGVRRDAKWSAPSLFEVASGPSELEFEAALEIVRRFLGHEDTESGPRSTRAPGRLASLLSAGTSSSRGSAADPLARSVSAGDSALQVSGSPVVTVATLAGALCSSTELRFLDRGDGTLLDCNTGLVWLKDANCFGQMTWQLAKDAAEGLNSGECGLTDGSLEGDWRLAEIGEFCSAWSGSELHPCPANSSSNSLINSAVGPPTVFNAAGDAGWTADNAFAGVQLSGYWSATEDDSDRAWVGSLGDGKVVSVTKIVGQLPVLAVRSGQ